MQCQFFFVVKFCEKMENENRVELDQESFIWHACLWLEEPALMAVGSKQLPLTASYFLSLSRFESHLGHVRNMPVTWG